METTAAAVGRVQDDAPMQSSTDRRHEGVPYLRFFRKLYASCAPQSYLEVGTRNGSSLEAFDCDAICVDPRMLPKPTSFGKRTRTFCYQMTSDQFFHTEDVRRIFPKGADIAFLDGMHRFEYLLRDFINTEKVCHRRSLIIMHDCFPASADIAGRIPCGGAWAGDVWKLVPILKEYRQDLELALIDCPPTGLFAVQNLDPGSDILQSKYHEIVAKYADLSLDEYGVSRLWSDLRLINSQKLIEDNTLWSLHLPTF